MKWGAVAEYVRTVKALLGGDEVMWDGAVTKMIHIPGFVPDRPIDIPFLIAAGGPKGYEVARELGDGVFCTGAPPKADGLPRWRARLSFGTVLDESEQLDDPRVLDAAGHALAAVFHGAYERGGASAVDQLPGGAAWRETIESIDPDVRHLSLHEGHLARVTARDAPAVRQAMGLLPSLSLTGTASEVRGRVEQLARDGVTEVAYQPAGSDIPRELERFMAAVS
jgi:5,10-methylenetetrahydromethanopterin reductase